VTDVVIGLSAVVIAISGGGEAVALTVRPREDGQLSPLEGLPFGPFDPDGQRTFEIALREFVTRQTRFELGFVEQLYTFGDKGREAPLADVGAGAARVISVGYLALAPQAMSGGRIFSSITSGRPLRQSSQGKKSRNGDQALSGASVSTAWGASARYPTEITRAAPAPTSASGASRPLSPKV